MGHGGGTIKRQSTCALLLILGIAMSIFPSAVGAVDQSASSNSATIGSNETLKHKSVWGAEIHGISSDKNVLEVNAATKSKKIKKTVKKAKAKTVKKYKKTTKKVKAYKVKVRYFYKGKWRYKYVTKYKTVSAASSYTTSSSYTSSGTADTSDPTLDAIMRSAAGYKYSSAYHTGADLVTYGAGDCWAFSDYLNSKFQAAGYQSRIIQYATSYSSQHRSVQLYQNGKWLTVPYRAYGYPSLIV